MLVSLEEPLVSVGELLVETSAIDALLAAARADMDRVAPMHLAAELDAGALLVDIRPVGQRERDGELPGAVVIDRNVLEWRLDPTSAHRIRQVTGPDLRIIIVCNEGYSSSLAAATLRQLGLHAATDVVGGFQALAAPLRRHRRPGRQSSQGRRSSQARRNAVEPTFGSG